MRALVLFDGSELPVAGRPSGLTDWPIALAALMAFLLPVGSAPAQEPASTPASQYGSAEHPANHRGLDGTGVFPARGLVRYFDEQTNVLWKTPLPNLGMSSPVVVGGKVFVTCDPGWKSDCPVLLAVDRTTGGIAWQAELDNLDSPQWDDAARAEGKRLRAEEFRFVRRVNEVTWQYRQAQDDAARAAITEAAAKDGLVFSANPPAFGYPRDHERNRGYQTLVRKGYFSHAGWSDNGRFFSGQAMPSAVSDGERVYVLTNLNAVACHDLEGRRLWIKDTRVPFGSGILTASPCLVGNVLVVFVPRSAGVTAMGYDKRTGAELWRRVLAPSCYQYAPGSTPVPLILDGTPAVYLTSGHVLRVSDGRILGTLDHPRRETSTPAGRPQTHFGNYGNSVARGDRLFVNHGSYGDPIPGVYAFRLKLEGGKLLSQLLWSLGGERGTTRSYQHLILDGERIVCGDRNCIVDAGTGRMRADLNGATTMDPGPIQADGLLIVADKFMASGKLKGRGITRPSGCDVRMLDAHTLVQVGLGRLDVDPPGGEKTRQRVARVIHDTWGWGGDGFGGQQCFTSPIADGNCLFLRSNDNLYCIGPAVRGTLKDDPAVVTQIRAASQAADLLPHLGEASAQLRYEAVKRMGELRAALPETVSQDLARLLADDAYAEIRAAAFTTLDACDPHGRAGWTCLSTEMTAAYGQDLIGRPGYEEQVERRWRVRLLLQALGADGPALLARHWSEAQTPALRCAFVDAASTFGWRIEPLLADAVRSLRDPLLWKNEPVRRLLPAYFAAADAAADPAAAEELLRTFPKDWTLYPTFAKHLPKEKLLAWIEPFAVGNTHLMHRQRMFLAWEAIGKEASASMERVQAALAANEKDKLAPEFAKQIAEAIARMKGQ